MYSTGGIEWETALETDSMAKSGNILNLCSFTIKLKIQFQIKFKVKFEIHFKIQCKIQLKTKFEMKFEI